MGYYLIDGYNLLFALQKKQKPSFEKKRKELIEELDILLSSLSLKGKIVFDSQDQHCDYAPSANKASLEVIYAPRGYSADDYILERLEEKKELYLITVVTSDGALKRHCLCFRVKVLSINEFLSMMDEKKIKKKRSNPKPNYLPNEREKQRWLTLFEQKADS